MKENSVLNKPVGIWIRVSTEDQARGESPQHHEARAREYAKFNGWTVKEAYDMAGVSGKTVMEQPETKRMLSDIRRGHITGLIFSKLARLARNTKELLEFSDIFRQCQADIISLQEKIDTSSPAGRILRRIGRNFGAAAKRREDSPGCVVQRNRRAHRASAQDRSDRLCAEPL